MSGFPVPLGGGSFEQQDRYEKLTSQTDRAYGRGVFTEDKTSVIRRTTKVIGNMMAGLSLTITRAIENIFPDAAHKEDLLAAHEQWLRLVPPSGTSVEERRALLLAHKQERPDARLWKIANALEKIVGVGNVTPAQNMAAQLDLAGYPRQGMFVVAFGVPLAAIHTLGQIERLDALIKRFKPVTVLGHVTHPMGGGFLTDDPDSLTDRDVLED
jgi:hypothetical protein